MKALLVTAVVALLGGLAIRIILGAHVTGPVMLLMLVALPIVGLLITIDDELPGGINYSRGPWRHWENWADLAVRASLCGVGFALDVGWRSSGAIVPWLAGAASIVVLIIFGRRIYHGSVNPVDQ